MIRAAIVDDEPLARDRVRFLAANVSDLALVGESDGRDHAVRMISEVKPDLLFLDIQMPETNGFQLLERLPSHSIPTVIFTTAFDQHAVRAFETHAVDYLMKPLQAERFAIAVARAREQLAGRRSGAAADAILKMIADHTSLPAGSPYLTRITVRSNEKVVVVRTADVAVFEIAGNYVVAHVGSESHVIRESLRGLESQLDTRRFLRVSRSAIVNLDQISALQPLFKNEHAIVLRNGKQITMTCGLREVERALRFS
jgi:two-component system, LytTR family, response regulator